MAAEAIAEPRKPPKSSATIALRDTAAGVSCHDLRSVSPAAAAWAARERAAVFGDLQLVPDRLLRGFRAVFSRPAAGAVGARADRRSYETGRAHAPAGGGGDPPVRPATGLSSLTLAETGLPALTQGVTAGRLTKSPCMAGKRFDSAARHAIDHRQPYRWASIRRRCQVYRWRSCSSPRSYRGERAAEWSWQWRWCREFRGSAKPIRSTTC